MRSEGKYHVLYDRLRRPLNCRDIRCSAEKDLFTTKDAKTGERFSLNFMGVRVSQYPSPLFHKSMHYDVDIV